MARRISKRKKPAKEKFQLKERWKIEQDVFDKRTALTLAKLMDKGIIKNLNYPVSEGKEAVVFKATNAQDCDIAVKIYKVETSPFMKKMLYLEGDPRFKLRKKTPWSIVSTFAKKEFKNLMIAKRANVACPCPIFALNNIVVMEFLGKNGIPYPKLKDVKEIKKEWLNELLLSIKKMYSIGLVHADFSPYNIVVGPKPFILDFAQGVVKYHPHFDEFLKRDVKNILSFFNKKGISKSFEEVLRWVREH